jgi:hypothetical protein
MGKAEQYRHHAAECLRLARKKRDPTEKDLLLGMAEAWRRLAEHVRKTADHDADDHSE